MKVKKKQSIVGKLSSSNKEKRIVFVIVVILIWAVIGLTLNFLERKNSNESSSNSVPIEHNNDKTVSIPLQIMRVDVLTNSEKKVKNLFIF